MRHIIPISGKDSLATAIVQVAREPELNYEFVFNPTGAELPEVFAWLEKVEEYFGKKIIRVGKNLEAIIEGYNYFLPSGRARYCTKESKILPFIEWIGGELSTVYYGIRADEDRDGFNNTLSPNILPKYPLQEIGAGIKEVYLIINSKGLKPPTFFWQRVYDEVCQKIGFDVRTIIPEWLFDMLFAWRSRANCYFCFNQRLYELVGLLEFHPDLFARAEDYEYMGGEKAYYWNHRYPMMKIRQLADSIRSKRVLKICKIIEPKLQLEAFDDDDKDFVDFLAVKSCGMFCGK